MSVRCLHLPVVSLILFIILIFPKKYSCYQKTIIYANFEALNFFVLKVIVEMRKKVKLIENIKKTKMGFLKIQQKTALMFIVRIYNFLKKTYKIRKTLERR